MTPAGILGHPYSNLMHLSKIMTPVYTFIVVGLAQGSEKPFQDLY